MKHLYLLLVTLFMGAGCVTVKKQPAAASWPKPVATVEVKQFDGVYGNQGVDPKTNEPSDKTLQLFDFLTNRGHQYGNRGRQVEIRSSPDGASLHVRLVDNDQMEVDSVELHRGVDFDLTGGFLNLHGSFSGLHNKSTNLGAFTENQYARLCVSSTGALLGKRSDSGVGLLFYFVPMAGASEEWMLWPKYSQTGSQ